MAVVLAYNWPVATPGSTTPPAATTKPPTIPTPPSSVAFNSVEVTLTGDNTATTVTITHSLGLTAGELAAGWPKVNFEPLLAAYYTAQPLVGTKTANQVVINFNTTGVSAFANVRIERPQATTR